METPNKKYSHIIHFGCRLNQYETDSLDSAFSEAGISATTNIETADYVVLNTCTVTNISDYKSRAAIRKVQKRNAKAKIIVTGCYATTDQKFLSQEFSNISVVPNSEKPYIVQNLLQKKDVCIEKPKPKESAIFDYHFRKQKGRVRAYLKIQDGCNKKCSYCKIPQARGAAISRNFYECIRELKHLVSLGFCEISITGVNIGTYYSEGYKFADLIRALSNIDGNFFLRISSIEPPDVNEDFIKLFDLKKVAKFAHIPLQTGSRSVLKHMHRGYTLSSFSKKIEMLKKQFPQMHIGTDLIVGFPGESEKDFKETIQYIKKMQFDNIHFFPFSKRKDTPVISMLKNKKIMEVNGEIIKERTSTLHFIQEKIVEKRLKDTEGKIYRGIIISENKNGSYDVLTENYIKVCLQNVDKICIGELVLLKYSNNKEAVLV